MLPDKLYFEVAEQDILEGCRRKAGNCPVARAVNRAVREGEFWPYAFVSRAGAAIYENHDYALGDEVYDHSPNDHGRTTFEPPVMYNIDVATHDFIDDFDDGREVRPFIGKLTRKKD